MMNQSIRSRGFTLIEVMIVVAIVAILAAVALPSYNDAIERGRRRDAQAVLMEAQQFVERYFTENRTYVGANAALPVSLTKSPREGSNSFYVIAVSGEAVSSYTISATPSNWTPRQCGTISINQIGTRSITNPAGASNDDVNNCFSR